MFIDVATFGTQADACAKYLAKGRAVAVTGRLVYREWTTTAPDAAATTSSAASSSADVRATATSPPRPTTRARRPPSSNRRMGRRAGFRRRRPSLRPARTHDARSNHSHNEPHRARAQTHPLATPASTSSMRCGR